ncbi:DEAD/DEAH box helicase [Arthrobacter sp. MPF02]|uniref:DEAD/DEAH box helicase n=1 Tax=Arthrobacter sp. MPF02 TaxID=3388492 RepID=UPI003984BBE9
MPLDLKKINAGKITRLIQPRDIFAALPDKPWPRLRPEQGEVLKSWFDRRTDRDLVIKLNTGSGKTLVGLLTAQSSLNEGVGPAVYLVPDTFLIKQVVAAATEVGITVTEDPTDQRFLSNKAILIATFHRLINGQSTFGVRGYKEVIPLGVIIVDDAHAALAAARNQFSAILSRSDTGYQELLELFAHDLKHQSPKGYSDLAAGDYSAPLRVPPKAIVDRASATLEILRKYKNDKKLRSFYFSWPFVADHISLSVITFTRGSVEIKLPCPHVDLVPSFALADRRIYLTATLDDEGVLVTELGARPDDVRRPITPERASDLGDRLILAPLSINPNLSETLVRKMAREFADGVCKEGENAATCTPINVVVLVPSDKAAAYWEPYANQILHVTDMAPTIDKLSDGEHVGLVVLVNKYDGVDLPHSACRLLIIDGIPAALGPSDQREAAALIGSRTFEARKVQRIEQGMGRGIRDVEDYCAVLLMTRDAALTLRSEKLRSLYSPATRAQIELSEMVSEQIENEGLGEIRKALNVFLQRDEEWVGTSRAALADVEYEKEGRISEISVARRRAFDKSIAGDIDAAVTVLRSGIDSISDDLEKGWHLEELASYQQLIEPLAAQKTLSAARGLNSGTLKPYVSPPKKAIKGPALQGTSAAEYLAATYSDANTLRLGFGSIFDNISWGLEETASLAEEQFRLLGLHLGFSSIRPEKDYNDGGPDNLWRLSPNVDAVIELKTEVNRNDTSIIKSEAGQLLHSLEWSVQHHPEATKRIPVLVHPGKSLHEKAQLPVDTRIITPQDLEGFRDHVIAFANTLASAKSWTNAHAVTDALKTFKLISDQVITVHSSRLLT